MTLVNRNLADLRLFIAGIAARQAHASNLAGVDLSGVVQQTMLELTTAKSPGPESNWQVWCLTIFRRNLSDEFRRQRAARRDYRKVTTISDEISGSRETPSHAVAKAELVMVLLDAIRNLSASQQEVIRCRYFDRMSIAEIAGLLDRSEASVAGLLRRGLEKLSETTQLRNVLDDWFPAR